VVNVGAEAHNSEYLARLGYLKCELNIPINACFVTQNKSSYDLL
jgi:hypothetical protein